jgi:hypothetical protein
MRHEAGRENSIDETFEEDIKLEDFVKGKGN